MHILSILNRVQLHYGFVYVSARWQEQKKCPVLEIQIWPRKNERPACSACGTAGSEYETLPVRRFEFIPLWGIAVFFMYAMRRVDCPRCGVKVVINVNYFSLSGSLIVADQAERAGSHGCC
jgi:transposase